MEATKRCRSLSEAQWARVMGRFAASGTTVSVFCQREGLNVGSFYRWRARVPAVPGDGEDVAQASQHNGFVDLGALRDASPSAGAWDLRLELGGGLSLHLVRR